MTEVNRRLKERRSAGGEESGFTLIELLIVIVVLGILAAIVVFALSGVTGKSITAACQSDAKTVGVGVAALQAENPTQWQGNTPGNWKTNLLGPSSLTNQGAPFLQSWPTGNSNSYTITISGNTTVALSGSGNTPVNGAVIVHATKSGKLYDATKDPVGACSVAHLS